MNTDNSTPPRDPPLAEAPPAGASPAKPPPASTSLVVTFSGKDLGRGVGALASVFAITGGLAQWNPPDPFLEFFIIGAVACVLGYWVLMASVPVGQQLMAARTGFSVTAVGLALVVAWRYIAMSNFVRATDRYPMPFGFLHGAYNYMPYLLLLILFVLAFSIITLYYTDPRRGSIDDRLPLFRSFAFLLVFLAICRLAWHIIDAWGIRQLPADFQAFVPVSQQLVLLG